jgi:hypothetical protein
MNVVRRQVGKTARVHCLERRFEAARVKLRVEQRRAQTVALEPLPQRCEPFGIRGEIERRGDIGFATGRDKLR